MAIFRPSSIFWVIYWLFLAPLKVCYMQTVICQKLPVGILLKIENYLYSVSSKLGCFSLSSWKLVQQMPLVRVGEEKGIKKKSTISKWIFFAWEKCDKWTICVWEKSDVLLTIWWSDYWLTADLAGLYCRARLKTCSLETIEKRFGMFNQNKCKFLIGPRDQTKWPT